MAQSTRRDAVLGIVRWCAGCREWWPDDDEFFYSIQYRAGTVAVSSGRPYVRGVSGVTRQCKACHADRIRRWKTRERLRMAAERRMTGHCQTPGCIVLVPSGRDRCHGCAGRTAGPLTLARIRALLDTRKREQGIAA